MTEMPLPTALILAGGRSSRMGTTKAYLDLAGETLLGRIVGILAPQVRQITLNAPADFPNPQRLPLVPDCLDGQLGPLAGVVTGLRYLTANSPNETHLLTVPCDSPFLPADLAGRLQAAAVDNSRIVIARSQDRDHPVFGLWPLALADDLETWLAAGDRRISTFLSRHSTSRVEFALLDTREGPVDPFFNINTPEDLEEARRYAEALL